MSSQLPRILEPELMDTSDEALAYDAMDHREVNARFVEDLMTAMARNPATTSHATAPRPAGTGAPTEVLDLGTGTAQIPIELCRRCEAVRVLAIDGAASMLDVAIANIDIAGLRDRIRRACEDAKQLPYAAGRFPIVMSNSILHHIPEPIAVLREAVRVAAPGGLLFFRDLLRPHDEAALTYLVREHAPAADEAQQKMFADSLRAALTLHEVRAHLEQLGFTPETVEQTSDRHWTWAAFKPAAGPANGPAAE